MVDPLSYFSFQPVLHDWRNKGCGMCYPVCGMVHIKEPLLLLVKSSVCGGSGFPFSLSEWSLTPYNRKQNVFSASLNKTFPSFLQGSLFMWEQFQDSYNRMFHAHRSNAGIALVVLRILLAGLFAWNLHSTISAERSTLKREFYGSFTRVRLKTGDHLHNPLRAGVSLNIHSFILHNPGV